MPKWKSLSRGAAALVALAAVACVGPSAATKLTVTNSGRAPYVGSDSRCANTALAVDVVATTATVTGINSSACGDLTLELYTHGDGITLNNSGTISGTSMVFTLAQVIAVDAVTVTIDTWGMPTNWTHTASPAPGGVLHESSAPSVTS
jgi:hypothetical protein